LAQALLFGRRRSLKKKMSGPGRLGLGWAIMWTDGYQAPIIVTEGIASEVKGFFRELTRGSGQYPFNVVNPQTETVNKLGRTKKYCHSDDIYRFK